MASTDAELGVSLPRITSPVPGERSRALARRLASVESRNITRMEPEPPPFWVEARGANVRDADGNVYIDLTAGFGVAAAGHAPPAVVRAISRQAARLSHGLGDVYPPAIKVELLERLARITPGDLSVAILGSSGAEGVEAALKTALLATGRAGIIAFEGAYHGLTLGALAVTGRDEFKRPFRPWLLPGVHALPFPDAGTAEPDADLARALGRVRDTVEEAERGGAPIGAVLVEPILGRGGIIVPPRGFLAGLRDICDGEHIVLILDEIYTGLGRTGRWFACDEEAVVPDLLVVGKALTGTLPLSAAVGRPRLMEAWPPSAGEAIHTSTFLGNPIACAAALAQLDVIEQEGLVERANTEGRWLRDRLEAWRGRFPAVAGVRGRGLLLGVALADPESGAPSPDLAGRVVSGALARGVILLTEGPEGSVLAFTPPLDIPRELLEHALAVLEEELDRAGD